MNLTRRGLVAGGLTLAAGTRLLRAGSARAASEAVTIAFNVGLPAWDPTVGGSAVNPTIQAIYQSVFDQFIGQDPDLSFTPGILEKWGWNDAGTGVWMDVRKGVMWHDGSALTPDDIVWSLTRAGDPKSGNPIQFIWGNLSNFKVEGHRVTADAKQYDPVLFKWMAFLTGYVLPKAYFEKVGPEGFEKKPVGSGPYMVDAFERNAFVRLKANPHYWGGKPAFDTVVFKFVTDGSARIAEIESGRSDVTLEIPYEEFDRLKGRHGLIGVTTPTSNIGMIFITNEPPMLDANVRHAMVMSVDKKLLVDKLLRGYGVPIDTLEAPQYEAFDASITTPHDPHKAMQLLAASGYSPKKPVTFRIQTTRGYMPKDYEMIEAIVGMWRRVGIHADIEVYEIAKHFELRAAHRLAPAAFYNWGDAIGDPTTSVGFAMFGPSPHSAWKTKDVDDMIGPLWGERDEAKRIAGWKAVDRYVADNALVLPLLQYVQPILHKSSLKVVPSISGSLQPAHFTPA
jgi:peptide/nickel transport system substrate-binding protein